MEFPSIVHLNVVHYSETHRFLELVLLSSDFEGGQRLTTTLATLRAEPDSMLVPDESVT